MIYERIKGTDYEEYLHVDRWLGDCESVRAHILTPDRIACTPPEDSVLWEALQEIAYIPGVSYLRLCGCYMVVQRGHMFKWESLKPAIISILQPACDNAGREPRRIRTERNGNGGGS